MCNELLGQSKWRSQLQLLFPDLVGGSEMLYNFEPAITFRRRPRQLSRTQSTSPYDPSLQMSFNIHENLRTLLPKLDYVSGSAIVVDITAPHLTLPLHLFLVCTFPQNKSFLQLSFLLSLRFQNYIAFRPTLFSTITAAEDNAFIVTSLI
jgi:hypothetical protein